MKEPHLKEIAQVFAQIKFGMSLGNSVSCTLSAPPDLAAARKTKTWRSYPKLVYSQDSPMRFCKTCKPASSSARFVRTHTHTREALEMLGTSVVRSGQGPGGFAVEGALGVEVACTHGTSRSCAIWLSAFRKRLKASGSEGSLWQRRKCLYKSKWA